MATIVAIKLNGFIESFLFIAEKSFVLLCLLFRWHAKDACENSMSVLFLSLLSI